MRFNYFIFIFVVIASLLTVNLVSCGEKPKTEKVEDFFIYMNHHDSAKYVGIETCKQCHQEIYNSFIKTGMGKSFDLASKTKSSGNFHTSAFYDKDKDFYYTAFFKNDSLYFKEFRLEGKDTVYKRIEKVDFIVGSGQHTNSHMQMINGHINQMPMTFYTQKQKWDLPPGFENGFNSRFSRKIDLECMSCHNSYPDFVLGSDNKFEKIPEGINCERCHGPGSIHVAQRSTGEKIDTSKYIDYSIVNPGKLPIDKQFDVCMRCHLQGNAVLKEGKSFYDFKPGMKLSDYVSVFLPRYKNDDENFIMASHADRLKQSQCFIKSFKSENKDNKLRPYKEALTCVTCHNPHVSVRETNTEVFNNACKNCHSPNGNSKLNCTDKNYLAAKNAKQGHAPEQSLNCVSCHMPSSGSSDIPHVTVHDHYIRKPLNKKQVEKIKEFVALKSVNEEKPDDYTLAKAYLQQYEKFERNDKFLNEANKILSLKLNTDLHFLELKVNYFYLKDDYEKIGKLIQENGNTDLFKKHLNKKTFDNQNAWTCYRVGEAFSKLGVKSNAILFFQQACALAPYFPDFSEKLATAYAVNGDLINAEKYYQLTLQENPKHVLTYSQYGFLKLSQGKMKEAEELFNKGLSYDPDNEKLLLNKVGFYNATNQLNQSQNLLKKIIKKFPSNEQAKQILDQVELFLKTQNTKK